MNIHIIVGRGGEDTVVLNDRSHWAWDAWLTNTENAVKTIRAAIDAKRITPEAQAAHTWLKLCGVDSNEKFLDLEKHLPQLRLPADRTNARYCVKCGSRIWGKMALLTGLGSECRRNGNHVRQARRIRHWVFERMAGLEAAA